MPRLASFKVILYFVFLMMMDATILPVFRIGAVYPSFLCLFVCYAAFEWGAPKTMYVAFWVGLLRDFLGGGMIGMEASLFVGLAFLLDFAVQKMEKQFPGIYMLITFLFVLIEGVLRLLLGYGDGLPSGWFGTHLGLVVLTALYTSVLLPVFYFLTDRWLGHKTATKQYELFR
ncbi:MAG TPA: rod shape-determining protein MreD [Candidatus Omnitrophota bacterium]|nr:rod shape-determining protein MreD [Candidatus Omnitrophota bacterium]HPS37343.1 rod shape-determining protein MreD [Candidatus Omnitrophota bacterium]